MSEGQLINWKPLHGTFPAVKEPGLARANDFACKLENYTVEGTESTAFVAIKLLNAPGQWAHAPMVIRGGHQGHAVFICFSAATGQVWIIWKCSNQSWTLVNADDKQIAAIQASDLDLVLPPQCTLYVAQREEPAPVPTPSEVAPPLATPPEAAAPETPKAVPPPASQGPEKPLKSAKKKFRKIPPSSAQ